MVKTYRVGALQWLILGALVQAHSQSMTVAELSHHLKSEGVDFHPNRDLSALIKNGTVEVSAPESLVRLTEYGAEARRAVRRTIIPHFLPVDDRLVRFTAPEIIEDVTREMV